MAPLFNQRWQGKSFPYLIQEIAARNNASATLAGFQTIDGELVSYVAGEYALRTGTAVLVGGLLVGTALSHSEEG